jgi:lysophospholipase L1-like esterase
MLCKSTTLILKRSVFLLLMYGAAHSQTSSVRVVSPNGLQQWEAGSQRNILFSASAVSDVRIEYSSNAGSSWTQIVASTPAATGSFAWSVPTAITELGVIRISSVANPAVLDESDQLFSVVARRPGNELDFVFYSDSPTPVFYDPSFGFVTAPSTLERVGEEFPVSTQYSLSGNYALKLAWSSRSGGDWGMAVAGIGWVPRDTWRKDNLVFHVLSTSFMFSNELPLIYLEDLNNHKTAKIPLRNFLGAIGQELWQRVRIPLQAFRDNPGQADLSQIKTVFFGQDGADETLHTWYIDDVRMVGVRPFSDSVKVIAVLGSSTAAGAGPSTLDSAWVWRYRRYINAIDTTARVMNFAVGGYTTYDVMPTGYVPPAGRPTPKPSNNISAALAYRPAALVVNLPSNDVAYGYSVMEQLANYDTLHSRSTFHNVPIWIMTSQPRNISDPVVRDRLRVMTDSILTRHGGHSIDVWNGLANSDGTILPQFNQGDGIHLNDAGHRLIYNRVVAANIWQTITSIERTWQIPETFVLEQNYPNPFNPSTTINYQIPRSGHAVLKVFDVLGREVSTLVNEVKEAGTFSVAFSANNLSRQNGGGGLASGVYYYRLTVGSVSRTKKMMLLQ